jgi:hypothetical protein
MIAWMTLQEISFSILILLSVIHLEWSVDGGVFIVLPFISKFLVGQIDLFRNSAATFSGWWPLSYDLP